jgi:hypothetical protein
MKLLSRFWPLMLCLVLIASLTGCANNQSTPISQTEAISSATTESSTEAIVDTTPTASSSPVASTEPSSTSNISPSDPVQAYADPATETTLQGLSENDYDKYTRYFSASTRAAVTREVFAKTSAQIQTQLGAYISKTYLSTETKDGYIIVHFKVKYAKANVGVRMVFDANQQVAGQWFE